MRARISVFLVFLLLAATPAQAVTIGPAMTKIERERRLPAGQAGETPRPSASSSVRGYESVLKSFLEADFVQSERQAGAFLSRRKQLDTFSDQVSYLRALSLMKLGRYAEARPLLKQLESEGLSAEIRAQAAYSLGDSFYFESKRAEADIYYKEAVGKYPFYGEAGQVKRLVGLERPPAASAPLQQMAVEEAQVGVYAVQVGAFARRRNAERLLNKLLRNHYDAYISREEVSKHFRVRVGHLGAEEEARALESRLKKDGYPTRILP